jgi:hypothetical protein
MSERILKLLDVERTLTGPYYLGFNLIRVFNDTAGAVLLTVKNTGGTTVGTVTVKSGEVIFIRKTATDTVEAAAGVKTVAIAIGD